MCVCRQVGGMASATSAFRQGLLDVVGLQDVNAEDPQTRWLSPYMVRATKAMACR